MTVDQNAERNTVEESRGKPLLRQRPDNIKLLLARRRIMRRFARGLAGFLVLFFALFLALFLALLLALFLAFAAACVVRLRIGLFGLVGVLL